MRRGHGVAKYIRISLSIQEFSLFWKCLSKQKIHTYKVMRMLTTKLGYIGGFVSIILTAASARILGSGIAFSYFRIMFN